MTDVLTKRQRSYNMSRIRSQNTRPEKQLRYLLVSKRIKGFRIHYNLPGKPDFVFPKQRLAIFVDGCFWHKCPLCFVKPETRIKFWFKKISGNVKRDVEINKKLKKESWKILRLWEHEINKNPAKTIQKIITYLRMKR